MRDKDTDLTQEYLRRILRYDPLTGHFTRLVATSNRVKVGEVAGWLAKDGYASVNINDFKYRVHRLAWFYVHGAWPEDEIDHKNEIKSDNRFENLREAERVENMFNRGARSDSKLGIKGVSVFKKTKSNPYRAAINIDGKQKHLGLFATIDEARAAYAAAAATLHGEFIHKSVG